MKMYNYEFLINILRKSIPLLPHDFDCVVGIPRSGIFPAGVISNLLGIGYATIEDLKKGFFHFNKQKIKLNNSKVILVDDSTSSGNTLNYTKHKLKDFKNISKVFTYVVFSHKGYNQKVDLKGFKTKEVNCIYEWNFLHKRFSYKIGFDMDGVLCDENNISGVHNKELYIYGIKTAKPLYTPRYNIDYIVTNRLEEFRDITEKWLIDNNVKYSFLKMWGGISFKDSVKADHLKHKINVLKELPILFYVESSYKFASLINYKLGIPVLCVDGMKICY